MDPHDVCVHIVNLVKTQSQHDTTKYKLCICSLGFNSLRQRLKFVHKCPIDNIPALVQIMAWRRPGDKSLSEPRMVSLPTHICVTRPQWVNVVTKQNELKCWVFGRCTKHGSIVILLPFPGLLSWCPLIHYSDVIMNLTASEITGGSTICSGANQRKHQSSESLASNTENVFIWCYHHALSSHLAYLLIRRPAIIWTNAGILLIGLMGTNFSEILIKIYTFSFKKMHWKMLSGKWRPIFVSASMC